MPSASRGAVSTTSGRPHGQRWATARAPAAVAAELAPRPPARSGRERRSSAGLVRTTWPRARRRLVRRVVRTCTLDHSWLYHGGRPAPVAVPVAGARPGRPRRRAISPGRTIVQPARAPGLDVLVVVPAGDRVGAGRRCAGAGPVAALSSWSICGLLGEVDPDRVGVGERSAQQQQAERGGPAGDPAWACAGPGCAGPVRPARRSAAALVADGGPTAGPAVELAGIRRALPRWSARAAGPGRRPSRTDAVTGRTVAAGHPSLRHPAPPPAATSGVAR